MEIKAVIFDFFGVLAGEISTVPSLDREVLDIVKNLRGKYRLGVLSNASGVFLRNALDEAEVGNYFSAIVASSEVGALKPEKEIYEKALELLGVSPEEAVFIDDNPLNAEGAKKLGINTIVFQGANQLKEALKHYDIS